MALDCIAESFITRLTDFIRREKKSWQPIQIHLSGATLEIQFLKNNLNLELRTINLIWKKNFTWLKGLKPYELPWKTFFSRKIYSDKQF